jgi:hypothetical protein
MVTLLDTYDVALLVPGDGETIPSVDHVQARGRHVGVVEFVSGQHRERSGPPQLSRVRMSADFVVQVGESELIERGLAKKAVRPSSTASASVSMPRQQ